MVGGGMVSMGRARNKENAFPRVVDRMEFEGRHDGAHKLLFRHSETMATVMSVPTLV
jgi:hypothetical protein